jgi:hypothetical protein
MRISLGDPFTDTGFTSRLDHPLDPAQGLGVSSTKKHTGFFALPTQAAIAKPAAFYGAKDQKCGTCSSARLIECSAQDGNGF